MGRTLFHIFIAFTVLCSSASHAFQDSGSIELPRTSRLSDLTDLVSGELAITIEYQPDQLRGSASLAIREAVDEESLWRIYQSVMEAAGFVVVQGGTQNVYRVVATQEAARRPETVLLATSVQEALERLGALDPRVSHAAIIVDTDRLTASQAATDLRGLMTNGASEARAVLDGELLLLIDSRSRLERVLDVLAYLDSRAEQIEAHIVALQDADPQDISEKITPMLTAWANAEPALKGVRLQPAHDAGGLLYVGPSSAFARVTDLIAQLDRVPILETRTYPSMDFPVADLARAVETVADASHDGALADQVRVLQEPLSQSLIVIAPATVHASVDLYMASLRIGDTGGRRVVRTFVVRNRAVEELSDVLSRLVEDDVFEEQDTRDAERGRTRQTTAPTAGGLTITTDARTNSLIISGETRLVEQLIALASELDRREPQVMIEVSLVAMSESETFDLGVELSTQHTRGNTTADLSSLFGLGSSGPLSLGSGLTGAVIRPGDYAILVRALETVNKGRTFSAPRLLVNNNETGSIRTVERQPFTSINASDTVATTSFGGTQDAGTTVTVTPAIAKGDHLILQYSVELSSFIGESISLEGGGVIPPPSQESTVESSVTIPDGYTVVTGGILTTTDSDGRSRLPLLGRIPILDLLFGTQNDSRSSTRFYVFIKASILKDSHFADLRDMSLEDIDRAGITSDHPPLIPIWIDAR